MNFRLKKILSIAGISALAVFLLFLLLRDSLLHFVLMKKLNNYQERFHTQVVVKESGFKGLNGLFVRGITLAPTATDTLLQIDSVFVNLRILPLFMGKIRFSNLEISNTSVHLIKNEVRNNFSFLMKKKSEINLDSLNVKINYSELAESLLNKVFDAIPSAVNFKNSTLNLESDSLKLKVAVPQFAIQNHLFQATIHFFENNETNDWMVEGNMYSEERQAQLKIFRPISASAQFPLLKQKWKLKVAFDTLQLNLTDVEYKAEELRLKGIISSQNLQLNHWRISPNNVTISNQTINYDVRVGSNYFSLDSSTTVTYNKVTYHPFLKYQVYPVLQFQLDANLLECDAQDFFASFPAGLFENIEGIKTSGRLFYKLHFFIDTKHPDDLQFSSYLGKKKFKILSFGKTNLAKINNEFQYTAYEKEHALRTFAVGPSNPAYTPLDKISNTLQVALLTSEDGNFYSHNGFNEDAFRKSIAKNFKEKRFVRGGSTISMQLVKNVFLTRNKTVARKIEEALIVWLIENNRISSKERMYEVYLNLIEWGPNIYGIGEASKFYFDKSPADLTLAESIFLAMIVPRPKGFKYNFAADGKLRESAAGYYSVISGHMVKKGIITEEEKNRLIPNVELKGVAKSLVLVKDSALIPLESEEELIIDN